MDDVHVIRGELDLKAQWAILRRRRWMVLVSVALCIVIALFSSYLPTPRYRASTTLLIQRQNPDILTFRDLSRIDQSWAAYADFYQTQYKILASDEVARRAAERLRIASHPEIAVSAARAGLLSRLLALLPRRGARGPVDPEDAATRFVLAGLDVSPVRRSQLVTVSWTSTDPDLAARVANAVADAYIAYNLESQYSTSGQASEFLADQIRKLKAEIDDAEGRLQRYGESKRIVSVDDSSNVTMRALADVAERRTAARTVLAEKEAAYRAAKATPPDGLPEVLDSPLIANLKAEYAKLEADLAQQTERFRDDWPEVRALRAKLDGVSSRLDRETAEIARKVVLAAEADWRRARDEVGNLDRLVREQEEAAQRLRRDAVEFTNLRAEVQKKRETLDALIARQGEMALSTRLKDLDATSSNIRIVSPARPPNAPFKPDTRLNLALGLLFGLGLGVGGAFFLDYLDNTVATRADVEAAAGLAVLASVPRHGETAAALPRLRAEAAADADSEVELVAARDGHAPASEAYRELRTAILMASPGSPPRRLMVSSALPAEGKSATTTNLAVALAQLGRRVVLVDTDLRRPRLHRVLGLDNDAGVSTWLAGLARDPERLARATSIPGLDVVTSGPIPPNPSELLDSPVFAELAERLVALGYDHVLFDSPPTLSVTDAVLIASRADAVVLVARCGRTPKQSLRHAVERYAQAGIRPVGVVLNDVGREAGGYGYGYGRYAYRHDAGEPSAGAGRSRARGA